MREDLIARRAGRDAATVTTAKLASTFNPDVAEALKTETLTRGYAALLGIVVERVEPGSVTCTIAIRPDHFSPVGVVHGGVVASLIDHTLSLAVYPLVEVGKWVATVEFKVNYLGSVKEGALKATGKVELLRKRLAVVRVDVENMDQIVAIAQGTLYVRDAV